MVFLRYLRAEILTHGPRSIPDKGKDLMDSNSKTCPMCNWRNLVQSVFIVYSVWGLIRARLQFDKSTRHNGGHKVIGQIPQIRCAGNLQPVSLDGNAMGALLGIGKIVLPDPIGESVCFYGDGGGGLI